MLLLFNTQRLKARVYFGLRVISIISNRMRAIHPKTGKPIQIMRTNTQITKTNRTILWYQNGLKGKTWERWSTVISDPVMLKEITKPDIVLITGPEAEKEDWVKWLNTATNGPSTTRTSITTPT